MPQLLYSHPRILILHRVPEPSTINLVEASKMDGKRINNKKNFFIFDISDYNLLID